MRDSKTRDKNLIPAASGGAVVVGVVDLGLGESGAEVVLSLIGGVQESLAHSSQKLLNGSAIDSWSITFDGVGILGVTSV